MKNVFVFGMLWIISTSKCTAQSQSPSLSTTSAEQDIICDEYDECKYQTLNCINNCTIYCNEDYACFLATISLAKQ